MYDRSKDFKFHIKGLSNSNYANDPERHQSVSGCVTKLEGVPVIERCHMQKAATLSTTEAELVAGVETLRT